MDRFDVTCLEEIDDIMSDLEDDFLFAKVMSNKEVCRKVLGKILGVSIQEVSMPATQKTINMLYDGKDIRLDVYINDDEETVYNVEMERGKQKSCLTQEIKVSGEY